MRAILPYDVQSYGKAAIAGHRGRARACQRGVDHGVCNPNQGSRRRRQGQKARLPLHRAKEIVVNKIEMIGGFTRGNEVSGRSRAFDEAHIRTLWTKADES